MSALRRRCALMEGLICFFTSRVRAHTSSGEHPFARKREIASSFFENLGNFSRGRMASLIRPDKTEVKWHSFVAKSLVLSPKAQAGFGSALDGTEKVSALVRRTILSASL